MSDEVQLPESVSAASGRPDRADAPVSETTERFLRAVVAEVPLASIEELHLFSPLRQGTLETGIAVLAARAPVAAGQADGDSESAPELPFDGDEPAGPAEVLDAPSGDYSAPELARPVAERHTVYTARYRYIIKGPERGKWEASVKAEAEAPLVTVETVVRGVQRRAGEESEIVRYTAPQLARALRVVLA